MSCENCEIKEEKMPESVPYMVYDMDMARAERHSKRWMTIALVELAMIFAMVVGFLIYESQWDTYSYEQDGEGVNIIGDSNEVNDNESETEDQTQAQPKG